MGFAYPSCPHCRYTFDTDDIWHVQATEFPTERDGDQVETECLHCKAPLCIELTLTPSWAFLDEDGDEIEPDNRLDP